MFDFELFPLNAVLGQIDLIIEAVKKMFGFILVNYSNGTVGDSSALPRLALFIMNNEYLLIGVSLMMCGFIIGLVKRLCSC